MFRQIRLLWRVEVAVVEARVRHLLHRCAFMAIGGIAAAIGLCMANAAAYFALEPVWGSPGAAAAVAAADFAVAGIFVMTAMVRAPDPVLKNAIELRQAAMNDSLASARDPVETALLSILMPLASVMVRSLRRQTKEDRKSA